MHSNMFAFFCQGIMAVCVEFFSIIILYYSLFLTTSNNMMFYGNRHYLCMHCSSASHGFAKAGVKYFLSYVLIIQ